MTGLDPTIVVAVFGLAGTLIGVLITRGTETRRIITGAPAGYAQLVDDLQQERAELRAEVAGMRDEIASMRTRVRGLETGQDHDSRLIEALRLYVLELRTALRRAHIPPPPAPPMLGIEDSGPLPVVPS